MFAWQDLLTAVCLMLILEGILPFLYPTRWKTVVAKLAEMDSGAMRKMGLMCMGLGLVGLFIVRA